MKRGVDEDVTTPDSNKKIKHDDSSSAALGLSEFINNDFVPICGQIKNRIEDFLVTEVDIDGKDSSLVAFDIPVRQERNTAVEKVDLPEDVVTGLNEVISKASDSYLLPAPALKEERTRLHKTIASFNETLSTETVKENDNSFIKVCRKSRKFLGNRDRSFDENSKFLHFTLLKWNIATGQAVLKLSELLRIHVQNISYAGLKDKRGITSQRVSCRMMEPKRLLGLNKTFFAVNKTASDEVVFDKNFIMGDFKFAKSPIMLGDISANKFCIVIRDCDSSSQENLDKLKDMLLQNGFINYFGLQRFGNSKNTHVIGRLLLKKDYKLAIETILTANDNHKSDVVQCLNHYKETGTATESFEMLKYKRSIEGLILSSLCKDSKNFKGALKSLHHKQQTLYAHAYQSYVWNKTVSKRIQTHGLKVLVGDLVFKDNTHKSVRHVTAEELADITLSDVVLPLPGYDIELPDNACKTYISQVLAEDAMSLEDFSGPVGKEFGVAGAYRVLIYKPSQFSAEVLKYSDENEKLVRTNVDAILDRSFEAGNVGDKVAIVSKFTLPKSCYATMLLREISKGNI